MTVAIILGLLAACGVPAAYIAAIAGCDMLTFRIAIYAVVLWAISMLTFAGVLIYRAFQ